MNNIKPSVKKADFYSIATTNIYWVNEKYKLSW